jgi:LCP family protein required for cell wall assembly
MSPRRPRGQGDDTQEFGSDLDQEVGGDEEAEDDHDGEEVEGEDDVVGTRTEEWSLEEGEEEEELEDEEVEEELAEGEEEEEPEEGEEEEEQEEAEGEPAPAQAPTLAAAPRARDRLRHVAAAPFRRLRRFRIPLWAKFLTASFLIVSSVAAATATSALLYLSDFASALRHGDTLRGVKDQLDDVDGGAAQTIMIIGSDLQPVGATKKFTGLSDTTMLLRLDPDRDAIALFSLPRDLKVNIPGRGIAKLNEAYTIGGPQLTLRVVRNLTRSPERPDGLPVHHLVNVDFTGFARAVNEIDCVYVDVDRRYFNASEAYDKINVQPGYQALCGMRALDYVRYRHTDNDVVRAARQQDFLREARQKVPPSRLFSDRRDLIDIFTEHTTSDINDTGTMIQVLKLFIEARDAPVKEIHFEGHLGPSFVTATPGQIDKAVDQFLGIEDTPGAIGKTAEPEDPERLAEAQRQGRGRRAAARKKKRPAFGGEADLIATTFGKQLAQGLARRRVKLPIYYPRVLEDGTDYAQKPRIYKINGKEADRRERAAYKWVFSRPLIGEYYGFMGTRWQDPPILRNPSETRDIGGREMLLFYDGDRLRTVGWKTDQGSFWLSNTLIQSLSEREMIEIARGMTELPSGRR